MGQARKPSNMMIDSSSFGGMFGLAITENSVHAFWPGKPKHSSPLPIFTAFTKLSVSADMPRGYMHMEELHWEALFTPLEDYPRGKKNLSERKMTVAHPYIQQFSGLQRPSKTSSGLLHLTHQGVSNHRGPDLSHCIIFLQPQCIKAAFCIAVTIKP